MRGTIGILNVGAGDTKLSFDKDNPMERARSARIVTDMLRRGYVLFVDTGGKNYQRVLKFDESVCEYIIADMDPIAATAHDSAEEAARHEPSRETPSDEGTAPAAEARPKFKDGRRKTKRVDAGATSGVAVHRSAGG